MQGELAGKRRELEALEAELKEVKERVAAAKDAGGRLGCAVVSYWCTHRHACLVYLFGLSVWWACGPAAASRRPPCGSPNQPCARGALLLLHAPHLQGPPALSHHCCHSAQWPSTGAASARGERPSRTCRASAGGGWD